MSLLEEIIYEEKKEKNKEFIVPNGIIYCENPSFLNIFKRKQKIIKISYGKEGDKNE